MLISVSKDFSHNLCLVVAAPPGSLEPKVQYLWRSFKATRWNCCCWNFSEGEVDIDGNFSHSECNPILMFRDHALHLSLVFETCVGVEAQSL